MNRLTILLFLPAITLIFLFLLPADSTAQFLFVTHTTSDRRGQRIPMPPGDYYGNVHANDFFYFSYPANIRGVLSSTEHSVMFGEDFDRENLHLYEDPVFNAYPVILGDGFEWVRAFAMWINDGNGRYMTRIELKGGDGIVTYQYELGEFEPHIHLNNLEDVEGIVNIRVFQTPSWGAIFINGQAEVFGEMAGNLTIGSAEDMWLVDDIWYTGANRSNGRWSYDEQNTNMPHRLGLVSEKNIIIKNNVLNGREDGFTRNGGNQFQYHSITIDAALFALGGSFTFQHQNDEWEAYQCPTPPQKDERGIIHLKGSVYQWRQGVLHNDNHNGTGYTVDWHYDYRIGDLPGWDSPFSPIVSGQRRYFHIRDKARVTGSAECDELILWQGSELRFESNYRVLVRNRLVSYATEEEPAFVGWQGRAQHRPGSIEVRHNRTPDVVLRHVVFDEGIELTANGDSITLDHCEINNAVDLEGKYIEITDCLFNNDVELKAREGIVFTRNQVRGELSIDGNPLECIVVNNTIVNPEGVGVHLNGFRAAELNSNIITGCGQGVVNDHWRDVELRYNDLFDNRGGNHVNCEPGEGSISSDPKFVDSENGDYNLRDNSPCIDAGDPELPPDPDGTRRDVGAFWRHYLQIEEKPVLPESVSLTAYPNPFNQRTTISFPVTIREIKIGVFDLQGRELLSERGYLPPGESKYVIDGGRLGGAGLYLVRLETGNERYCLKLVYLP